VIDVAMAEEDVADAGGIDAGREQPTNKAEAAAGIEQHARGARLDQDRGLVALWVQSAAGAEEDDARMRHRVRA
jgi:hypothetical protein